MKLFFLHHPKRNREEYPDEHLQVPVREPQYYSNEGSEFLDDAIRTTDQPLMYTEESIGVGSPENLL